MASIDSDNEPESILDNLNKTRQLWSSKADLGSLDYLIPKSPVSKNQTSKEVPHNDVPPSDIIRSDDQVVEDYELPSIKSMKSQWETPNSTTPPSPAQRAPAVTRAQTETKPTNGVAPVVVNREEIEEEEYSVELGALKEKFESAAKSTNYQRPKSPKSPISKSSIKEHVNKVRFNKQTNGDYPVRKTGKKIRFQDEQERKKHPDTTEHKPVEISTLSVDLSSIKSQFEKNKDEHLVSPATNQQARKVKQELQTSTQGASGESSVSPEVVRPGQMEEEEHFSVELKELKKKFESNSNNSTPRRSSFGAKQAAKPVQVTTPIKERKFSEISNESQDTPRVETIKSSEPLYDQMTGEESVKDKLQRFKEMSNKNEQKVAVQRTVSQKKIASTSVVHSEDVTPVETSEPDIVRSDPAGTPITPDYVPSIDLQQTKALFGGSKSIKRSSLKRSLSSSSKGGDSSTQSPPRTGRSPAPSSHSRNSSSHRSTASSRSPDSVKTPRSRTTSARSSNPADDVSIHTQDDDMSEIVRPPPAGTKETADYVPSVKVSSMKSMWESPTQDSGSPTSAAPPRRTLKKDWSNGNDEEEVPVTTLDGGSESTRKVVTEGSFEDRGGVVRPHTAGTKELPAYNLESNFLKSRAAMFSGNNKDEYKPRNKIQTNKTTTAEVVNSAENQEEESYTINLKGTKQLFESGGPVTPKEPERKKTEIRETPTGEVVRPPPAGTREESDIVPAADLQSAKKMFDGTKDEEKPAEGAGPKQMIDIKQEANQAMERDREIVTEKQQVQEPAAVESDSDSEGEYVLEQKQKEPEPVPELVQEPEPEPVAEQYKEEEVKQEEEQEEEQAAAVTPVRVAIPDEPEQQEQYQNEEKQAEEEPQEPEEPVTNDVTEPAQDDYVTQQTEEPAQVDDDTAPQENNYAANDDEVPQQTKDDSMQENNVDNAAPHDDDVTNNDGVTYEQETATTQDVVGDEPAPLKSQAPAENGIAQDEAPAYLE